MSNSVSFSRTARWAASGATTTRSEYGSWLDNLEVNPARIPRARSSPVAYSPDRKLLAAGCRDGTLRLFDAEAVSERCLSSSAHKNVVRSVAFSPGRHDVIATGSRDHTIKLAGTTRGVQSQDSEAHQERSSRAEGTEGRSLQGDRIERRRAKPPTGPLEAARRGLRPPEEAGVFRSGPLQ